MGIIVVTNDPSLIEHLDKIVTHDYTDEEFDEYWCINIKPFKCAHCNTIVCYAQAGPHMIIIWEFKDDDNLLQLAALLKADDYEPRIERYNRYLGPCVTWEEAEKLGWIESISH